MSVYFNLYIFDQENVVLDSIRQFAQCIEQSHYVESPSFHGPAYRDADWLQSPTIYDDHQYRSHTTLLGAIDALIEKGEGMVSTTVLAKFVRNNPDDFYDWPSSLAIYLLPSGHELTIGEGEAFSDYTDYESADSDKGLYLLPEGHEVTNDEKEDFSDDVSHGLSGADNVEFKGNVKWLIWFHGKNTPLIKDFVDSPMEKLVTSVWPNVLMLEDQWI